MAKKTISQLEAAARAAEDRARRLRAKAKKQTQAEKATLNGDRKGSILMIDALYTASPRFFKGKSCATEQQMEHAQRQAQEAEAQKERSLHAVRKTESRVDALLDEAKAKLDFLSTIPGKYFPITCHHFQSNIQSHHYLRGIKASNR